MFEVEKFECLNPSRLKSSREMHSSRQVGRENPKGLKDAFRNTTYSLSLKKDNSFDKAHNLKNSTSSILFTLYQY